ncbi:hypothetical protein I6A60_35965 [Frankia sp. AgB1.9]|uniref:hypothetical protein n=1 Tax=unclassified Frankia TaxID=2632575 RepID=UPI0019349235|nr:MULTISPECIES: hypothetical protein [unclassified Frankia]MBL7487784.1 hypothetical protein [Frankia sp. AgW1.1]MBL7553211.1 hypothetical protein [Frankia sp. AgB1.9]MBL7622944.1 hypothetical protein [Frankia sp. AgB1.8]
MTPTSPTPPHDGPLVTVGSPDPDHIHLIIRPGADATSITDALTSLPGDVFYLDHDGDPAHLRVVFRRLPPPDVVVPAAGWTPPTPNGDRPPVRASERAVYAVTAELLLGTYDRDILRPPPDAARPTVLTIVRLVRVRADTLARRPHQR